MIPTGEGPLWLSAIRDAYSRRVVAWETSARADADTGFAFRHFVSFDHVGHAAVLFVFGLAVSLLLEPGHDFPLHPLLGK